MLFRSNDTATTEIYTLSLHDALPISTAAAERVRQLFQDDGPGSRICLSTTHRAKGLEAPRVWMLAETYRGGTTEEDNLRYVAITRAQQELIYVTGK